jgi:hypothetical protein
LLLAGVVIAAGCGSASKPSSPSAAADGHPALAPTRLVTPATLARYPTGSPARVFLDLWSDLQFRTWDVAGTLYSSSLQRLVGLDRLIEAFKTQAEYFRTTVPSITSSVRRGRAVVVRYLIRDPSGRLMPTSISMVRELGTWRVGYDPQLDVMLRAAAQQEVQATQAPLARRPSAAAIAAGDRAARLQSAYAAALSRRGRLP